MPKFLCLPGFLQSGALFAEKSLGLRKLLVKKLGYELDYIDPPYVITNKDQLPFVLSSDPEEEAQRWAGIVEKNLNRCWWLNTSDNTYLGFDEAEAYLKAHIAKNGPYDGVLGFSQGAAMAAIVANNFGEFAPSQAPLKIGVFFSPFAFTVPRQAGTTMAELNLSLLSLAEYSEQVELNPQYSGLFQNTDTPTKLLAVYGSEDSVVPPVRTQYLCARLPAMEVLVHDGGHYMPNKKQFVAPLVARISDAVLLPSL